MKAVAVFPDRREVRVIDHPEPQVTSQSEVKLRILEVGVCGTDKEICAFHYGFAPVGSPHLVIGHEALGEVMEVGTGVTRFRPGDLAVLTVRRPCPHATCSACVAGRQDFCFTGDFTERGIKQRHGFMTEMVVDDEAYLVPVPGSLRDVAVLVEPLTIAEKALIQVWQVQQRLPWSCPVREGKDKGYCHRALVLGAGPIGLLGAMAFSAAGFETVVYSREAENSDKADLVRSFDAKYVSSGVTPVERIESRVGAIDVVYEATGASALSFEVLKILGANSVFVFTGVPGRKDPMPVDTDLIMRRMVLQNQVLLGTVNAGRDAFEAAVRDLGIFTKRWPDAVRRLFTGRYTLETAREPLMSANGIKSVIAVS
jgi:threonine dehydrogenase-like Zn-dependent dehydrogenase